MTLVAKTSLLIFVLAALVFGNVAGAAEPLQLDSATFQSQLEGVSADTKVLLEFYAHWCPACQRFAPEYEHLAALLNDEPKPVPKVLVARVDCAEEVALCSEFKIGHYPTIFLGPATDFIRHEDPSNGVPQYDMKNGRTAQTIIKWLNEQLQSDFKLDGGTDAVASEHTPANAAATTGGSLHVPIAPKAPLRLLDVDPLPANLSQQVDLRDIEGATLLAMRYMLQNAEALRSPTGQSAAKSFISLMAQAHPCNRCRTDIQQLQAELPRLWPYAYDNGPAAEILQLPICGQALEPAQPAHEPEWFMCRGSKAGSRGYTCGLWLLLHSLAARVEPASNGGAVWMAAIKGFVGRFFQCSDCAQHFMEMASEPAAAHVKSRKQAILWMWSAHNRVNRRLEDEDAKGQASDPAFPKVQWPPADLCPSCHKLAAAKKAASDDWNEDATSSFLDSFYNPLQLSSAQPSLSALRTRSLKAGRRAMETRSVGGAKRHQLLSVGLVALLAIVVLAVFRPWRSPHRTHSKPASRRGSGSVL
ncbi:hypothetical protein WJX74_007870 [Apatococcus lobatus]|uniref:Sulfhydryl oxidase n=1 Tax=Apatococcus lobatus TaxID=904363 RepID=A0AAW1QD61_9CHLO